MSQFQLTSASLQALDDGKIGLPASLSTSSWKEADTCVLGINELNYFLKKDVRFSILLRVSTFTLLFH